MTLLLTWWMASGWDILSCLQQKSSDLWSLLSPLSENNSRGNYWDSRISAEQINDHVTQLDSSAARFWALITTRRSCNSEALKRICECRSEEIITAFILLRSSFITLMWRWRAEEVWGSTSKHHFNSNITHQDENRLLASFHSEKIWIYLHHRELRTSKIRRIYRRRTVWASPLAVWLNVK